MQEEFDLIGRLGDRLKPVKVVDVGAMWLDGAELAYGSLLRRGVAEVIGFEPIAEECQKLNEMGLPGHRYLPYAIGDGSRRTFHQTNTNMTSSLYAPDEALMGRFSNLAELVQVVGRHPIQTHRLDDLPEVAGVDFLKLDVQGAELDVLAGARRLLERALVVQAEVEFVPLYEGQPLFGDVDRAMRESGFLFHRFLGIAGRAFRPLAAKNPQPFSGQSLWTDAVYVKSFMRLGELDGDQLAKLAVILHEVYRSRDLALLVLQHLEAKGGPALWDDYCTSLVGRPKERPPLA